MASLLFLISPPIIILYKFKSTGLIMCFINSKSSLTHFIKNTEYLDSVVDLVNGLRQFSELKARWHQKGPTFFGVSSLGKAQAEACVLIDQEAVCQLADRSSADEAKRKVQTKQMSLHRVAAHR